MIYLVHPTKFEYSQYFLAVQMQLSPSLAASLSFSLPLPHSISLSCSISLFLSLSFAAVSFHLPRPSHLACRSSSFAFACHELPLGSTPGCTAILGLPSPPPALLRSAFALSPPPPENSFAAHRGALWLPSHRSCISADAFVSVSLHCMCVSYGCHA